MTTLKQKLKILSRGRLNEHEPDKVLIVIIAIIVVFGLIMTR